MKILHGSISAERGTLAACLAGYLVLVLFVIGFSTSLAYDEHYYQNSAKVLVERGFSREYLLWYPEAAGPLYAVIHAALFPLTGLQALGIRAVNLVFFAGITGIMFLLMRLQKSPTPMVSALSLIGIPMTWVVAGLALTEAPSLFFLMGGVGCLFWRVRRGAEKPLSMGWAVVGGLSIGLSIVGRQTLLVVLLPLAWLACRERALRSWILVLLVSALPIPLALFSVWGGLVSPAKTNFGEGFSVEHLALALGYTGLAMLILAPRWLKMSRWVWVAALGVGWTVACIYPGGRIALARSLAERFLPAGGVEAWALVSTTLLFALGILLIWDGARRIWRERDDALIQFCLLAGYLLVGVNIKLAGAASRYVIPALLFLVLAAEPRVDRGGWRLARLLAGMVIGFSCLMTYYISA